MKDVTVSAVLVRLMYVGPRYVELCKFHNFKPILAMWETIQDRVP